MPRFECTRPPGCGGRFADQNLLTHFLKNIRLVGGLLQIVYFACSEESTLTPRTARWFSMAAE